MKVMRSCAGIVAALVAGAALTVPAAAQKPVAPDSVVRAAPLRVDAVRTYATTGAASALFVRLDSLRTPPAASLEQVLRELPLVTVRTNSRGEAQFSLRGSGSDARQVAVLMDGVPLHIGWDDRVDLSVLPAAGATTLTLVRGLPSVLHGPNVLGGVVDIGVAQAGALGGATRTSLAAETSVDQTGAAALSAAITSPFTLGSAALTLRAGGGWRDRPGLALPEGVAQPYAADDSPITGETLRANTQHTQWNAFVSGRLVGAGGQWLSLASSAFDADRGIGAELHSNAPRFWRYPRVARAVTVLSAGTGDRASPLGGRGDIELSAGYDAGRTEIVSYIDGTYGAVDATENADDRTLTLRLLSDQTVTERGELRLALTYVDTNHDEELSATGAAAYRQRIWSAGAETVWRIDTGVRAFPAVRVSLGGALDGADTPESGDKPALGSLREWGGRAGITATSGDGALMMHAGVSRRARFPALRELYSGALGRFEPNPSLGPETLEAAEAGVTWSGGLLELQGVAFYRRLGDAIEQVRLSDGKRQRVNLGAVNSVGIELLAAAAVHSRLTLSGDVTLQDVSLSGAAGTEPEYQPSVMGGAQVRVALPLDLSMTQEARYIGAQYCLNPNAAGQLRLDASRRWDMTLGRSFTMGRGAGSRVQAMAALDNVTDAAIYDQCGLPQAGRTFRLQLVLR